MSDNDDESSKDMMARYNDNDDNDYADIKMKATIQTLSFSLMF